VPGHLLLKNCLEEEVTRPAIERALKEDTLLWLDLPDTSPDTLALLSEVFKIHPLAVEDAHEFNQRPKVEDYEDFVYLVAYGSVGLDRPMVEVHCFYAEHFLVTVHRDEAPAIAEACRALARLHTDRRLVALYRVLDALVDSMFPVLGALDDRIDELQDQIFAKPTEAALSALIGLKRQLVDMRKVVSPQRDMVASMLTQVIPIPGLTAEGERYIRDLYDHLVSGSLDAYMSVVSNRLNDVMKQLTIIATVFLPLSFLTGFFGQNLGWLVAREGSLGAFLIFGLGTELAAVGGLFFMFRRRGWL